MVLWLSEVFLSNNLEKRHPLGTGFLGKKRILKIIYSTWNRKQPFINGCFNWMIPNLYIGNGCFTKHLFKTGCLGFQVCMILRFDRLGIVGCICARV